MSLTLILWLMVKVGGLMHKSVVAPIQCDPVIAAELGVCVPPSGGSGGGEGGGW